MEEDKEIILKISGRNNVPKTSTCIIKTLEEGKNVKLSAIGAQAVNQACKSIAVATSKIAISTRVLTVRMGFTTVQSNEDKEKTAMIFALEVRG